NRFEYNSGRKVYIDRDDGPRVWRRQTLGPDVENAVNPLTQVSYKSGAAVTRISAAEMANPHAACFCLSRAQLDGWNAGGRSLYGRVPGMGPYESGATGCRVDWFDLYKPHPANAWFLEVRHLTTKYSDRLLGGAGKGAS